MGIRQLSLFSTDLEYRVGATSFYITAFLVSLDDATSILSLRVMFLFLYVSSCWEMHEISDSTSDSSIFRREYRALGDSCFALVVFGVQVARSEDE